jgi:hypothetical protein
MRLLQRIWSAPLRLVVRRQSELAVVPILCSETALLRARSAGWRDLGIDIAVGSLVDLIPYGGLVHSAVTGGARVRKEEREWTTILLALNQTG